MCGLVCGSKASRSRPTPPSIDEPSVLPCYTDAADSATVRPCELAHHGPSYTTLCHADAAKVPSSVPRMRLRGGGALESKTSCRVRAVSGEPLALVGGSSDTVLCRSPLSARSGAAVGAVGPGRCTDIRESPVADAANDMWSSALGPDIYEPSPLPDYGGAADNATTRSRNLAHRGSSRADPCCAGAAEAPFDIPCMRLRGGGIPEGGVSWCERAIADGLLASVGGPSGGAAKLTRQVRVPRQLCCSPRSLIPSCPKHLLDLMHLPRGGCLSECTATRDMRH